MFDKLLHLSKSQVSAMSRLRSHDLREAISDLLTVTMYFQDSLSRLHHPGLHKIDLCPRGECVDSHPCVFTNPRAAELSVHSTIVPGEQTGTFCSIGTSLRFPRKLHQPVPSTRIHQNSNKPCSASWRTHTRDTTIFAREPLTQTSIPE